MLQFSIEASNEARVVVGLPFFVNLAVTNNCTLPRFIAAKAPSIAMILRFVVILALLVSSGLCRGLPKSKNFEMLLPLSHDHLSLLAGPKAQASACPFIMTPHEIPDSSRQALADSWKKLMDSKWPDPQFGTF